IHDFAFTNTTADPPTFASSTDITVPAYTVPAKAPEPAPGVPLDTSDARFVNASAQVGDMVFNVHSVDSGGFATPESYQFNAATSSVVQSGFFFASATSSDWNASLAVNTNFEVFVTWSSTDTTVKPQVRISGRQAGDPAGA